MADSFSIVRTTEDPLTADRLVEVLRQEKIDAFTRERGAASTASFEPAVGAFYELFVPEAELKRASALVDTELAAIESEGVQNAAAAEEEAMSGQNPTD